MKCSDCRFWSDRLAMAVGGGPVKAVCLVTDGPLSGQYTAGFQGCSLGKSNQYGAVDTRGEEEEIAALYAEDDAREAV